MKDFKLNCPYCHKRVPWIHVHKCPKGAKITGHSK